MSKFTEEEVDRKIKEWHSSKNTPNSVWHTQSLWEYLGWTHEEYQEWIKEGRKSIMSISRISSEE